MPLLCVDASLIRSFHFINKRIIGHNWWSVIGNALQNSRHAVGTLMKSSLNPLGPMSSRIFKYPVEGKTAVKSLILPVSTQKVRSCAEYPSLLQLGNGLNVRAVQVLSSTSDLNEDQL